MNTILETRIIRENEYESLYKHMKRDFPSNELAPFFAIKRNFDKKIYDVFFLTESAGGIDIGYAIITAPENEKFALINYFAVFPDFRSKGYGNEFLKILCGIYPDRIFFVEVENPLALKKDKLYAEALRRIKFYERAGFRILPTAKAKIFGVDMAIMANTNGEVGSVRKIMHSLYISSLGSKQWLRFIDVRD